MKNGLYLDTDGSKYWFLNGKRHREDGPAVEWVDGTKSWYLYGREYPMREYMKTIGLSKEDKVMFLLKWGGD